MPTNPDPPRRAWLKPSSPRDLLAACARLSDTSCAATLRASMGQDILAIDGVSSLSNLAFVGTVGTSVAPRQRKARASTVSCGSERERSPRPPPNRKENERVELHPPLHPHTRPLLQLSRSVSGGIMGRDMLASHQKASHAS